MKADDELRAELSEIVVQLHGYKNMVELYHEDNGDPEDYHEMSRVLDRVNATVETIMQCFKAERANAAVEARIVAYLDCSSKGGNGDTLRGYAKSRLVLLQNEFEAALHSEQKGEA